MFNVFLLCTLHFTHYTAFAAEAPRYDIEAQVDVGQHKITAKQTVTFTNNSDKPVSQAYFHIYPHRKYTQKEIRFLYRYAGYFKINPFPEGFQAGDLKVGSIVSQGEPLNYSIEGKDQTILCVNLGSALNPGEAREVTLDFSVDIPHSYGRFGWHNDITTLVRWYPMLSVLDNNGWHNYPFYIYHQPYFSQASYYKVKLKVDSRQVIASTGTVKDQSINPDGTKTIQIETDSPVRDFSLGISDKFLISTLSEGSIKINSYYLADDQERAVEAAQHARDLIKFYAKDFGNYPYPEFNIVPSYLGYGGTQSSNQIFIDRRVYKFPKFLARYFDFLISHETGHQWFYNIVGSDEYREMFLDEGMNSFWLLRHLENKYGKNAKVMVLPKFLKWIIPDFSFQDANYARYLYIAKNGLDGAVAGELSSFQEPSSIFALTYGKGAAVLAMLEVKVGKENFLKIVQRYTREFRFGNISLDEFMRICKEESKEDLGSFFEQWLKTDKQVDFAIKEVLRQSFIVENKGKLQMPVSVKIVYQDGRAQNETWDGQGKEKVIPLDNKSAVKEIVLDPDNAVSLDLDRANNYWPRSIRAKLVPLYFFAYEIPVFLPRDSYNLILGPSVGGSSLGLASSFQKPYDNILRVSSVYDFNGKEAKSVLGYEFGHIFKQQAALGFELFHNASDKEKQSVSGGKIYLRRELWPASYGLFDLNDHVTLYLVRDRELSKTTSGLNGSEDISNFYYRKKDEAIFGITGSFGRYGPYPDPDYGFKFLPTAEVAGHFLGGHDAFWRASFELDRYHLILPKQQHKIAGRVKIGWGESSDKRLFQLGGPDALRGYGRKTIEGAHMFLAGLEYRFPLKSEMRLYFLDNFFCLDKLQGVAFVDAGKAWFTNFTGTDLKEDVGLGLRMHFDLLGFLERAVLRIDIAQALNEPKEGPHFWFGISHSF